MFKVDSPDSWDFDLPYTSHVDRVKNFIGWTTFLHKTFCLVEIQFQCSITIYVNRTFEFNLRINFESQITATNCRKKWTFTLLFVAQDL